MVKKICDVISFNQVLASLLKRENVVFVQFYAGWDIWRDENFSKNVFGWQPIKIGKDVYATSWQDICDKVDKWQGGEVSDLTPLTLEFKCKGDKSLTVIPVDEHFIDREHAAYYSAAM